MGMVDIALLGNITLDDMLHHLQTDERTDPNARLTLKSSEKKSACISTLAFRCGGGLFVKCLLAACLSTPCRTEDSTTFRFSSSAQLGGTSLLHTIEPLPSIVICLVKSTRSDQLAQTNTLRSVRSD